MLSVGKEHTADAISYTVTQHGRGAHTEWLYRTVLVLDQVTSCSCDKWYVSSRQALTAQRTLLTHPVSEQVDIRGSRSCEQLWSHRGCVD